MNFKKRENINHSLENCGIDDFAIKKRHNYGIFLVDHDSREFVDIIDSRKVDNVQE